MADIVPRKTVPPTPAVMVVGNMGGSSTTASDWITRSMTSPTTIPNGVVIPKRKVRSAGTNLMERGECEGEGWMVAGRLASRTPRERPSNSWWNIMAVRSDADGPSSVSVTGFGHHDALTEM